MKELLSNKFKNTNVKNTFLYAESVFYRFEISKKNGASRIVYAPNEDLKNIHKVIKKQIEIDYNAEIDRMKHQHAYMKNKNIISNAEPHVKSKYILKLDIKDYFDSITFRRIFGKLKKKYNKDEALMIAQLACYRKDGKHISLAQGSPLAPILSNIIGQSVDIYFTKELRKYRNDIKYSRYSDDITISTNNKEIYEELNSNNFIDFNDKTGFVLNEKKRKAIYGRQRKIVTGLTINEKVNVSKTYKKELRNYLRNAKWDLELTKKIYKEKHGITDENFDFEEVMRGKVEFIGAVKGKTDNTYLAYANLFNDIIEFKYVFDIRDEMEKSIFSVVINESHGTFFIIEYDNIEYVITNYHVVKDIVSQTEEANFARISLNIFGHDNEKKIIPFFKDEDDLFGKKILILACKLSSAKWDEMDDIFIAPIDLINNFDKKFSYTALKIREIELNRKKNVEIHGYPNNPDQFSSSANIVKRIQGEKVFLQHAFGAGASGSPVIYNDKVIGIYSKGHDEDHEGEMVLIEKAIKLLE